MEVADAKTDELREEQPESLTYPSTTLRGHRTPVVSLDTDRNGLIASASEDGSIRLWDIREHKAVQGCSGPFSDAVNCVRFTPHDMNKLLCCCNRTLYEIDLRLGMIIREASEIFTAEDDIGNFDVHPKQTNIVAVADDADDVSG